MHQHSIWENIFAFSGMACMLLAILADMKSKHRTSIWLVGAGFILFIVFVIIS